jgi:hypothetical protein
MHDTVPNTKRFKIYINEGNTLDDRNYAYTVFTSYVVSPSGNIPEKYLIFPDWNWTITPGFTDWIYTDNFYNATYYRQMIVANEQRYKDIKYKYYQIDREYTDDYYVNMNDNIYIKDETQYKDYYQYRIMEESTEAIVNNADTETSSETINITNQETTETSNKKPKEKVNIIESNVEEKKGETNTNIIAKEKEENKITAIDKIDRAVKEEKHNNHNFYIYFILLVLISLIIIKIYRKKKF